VSSSISQNDWSIPMLPWFTDQHGDRCPDRSNRLAFEPMDVTARYDLPKIPAGRAGGPLVLSAEISGGAARLFVGVKGILL
jgi:hypothetical protein